MAIKTITKSEVREVRAAIDEALKGVGDKFGISIKTKGSATYCTSNFVVKIEAAVFNEAGLIDNREAKAFKDNAWQWNLQPEYLGQKFTGPDGTEYKLVGATIRSRKHPIICEKQDGSRIRLSAFWVQQGFADGQ